MLPFENRTGDPEQEYLSDGITDEMIVSLGRLNPASLEVVGRTSVRRYKRRDTPIDQIGRTRRVDYVLEGSAQREADRIHINAALIQVRDQTQRWSETYDKKMADIMALQSDVRNRQQPRSRRWHWMKTPGKRIVLWPVFWGPRRLSLPA